jgi:hypothetical protein
MRSASPSCPQVSATCLCSLADKFNSRHNILTIRIILISLYVRLGFENSVSLQASNENLLISRLPGVRYTPCSSHYPYRLNCQQTDFRYNIKGGITACSASEIWGSQGGENVSRVVLDHEATWRSTFLRDAAKHLQDDIIQKVTTDSNIL